MSEQGLEGRLGHGDEIIDPTWRASAEEGRLTGRHAKLGSLQGGWGCRAPALPLTSIYPRAWNGRSRNFGRPDKQRKDIAYG